jgi:hypothetical protein
MAIRRVLFLFTVVSKKDMRNPFSCVHVIPTRPRKAPTESTQAFSSRPGKQYGLRQAAGFTGFKFYQSLKCRFSAIISIHFAMKIATIRGFSGTVFAWTGSK